MVVMGQTSISWLVLLVSWLSLDYLITGSPQHAGYVSVRAVRGYLKLNTKVSIHRTLLFLKWLLTYNISFLDLFR